MILLFFCTIAGGCGVQSQSCVGLFETIWTAARQASLSFTISQSLLKLMSIESVNHPTILSSVTLFYSCPQSFSALGSFPMSQLFTLGGQGIRASALASVPPMNIQDWSPSGWTGLFPLQSKGLSRVFSSTTVQKHQFFSSQSSFWSNSHIHTIVSFKPSGSFYLYILAALVCMEPACQGPAYLSMEVYRLLTKTYLLSCLLISISLMLWHLGPCGPWRDRSFQA